MSLPALPGTWLISALVEALLRGLVYVVTKWLGSWVASALAYFGVSLVSQHFLVGPLLQELAASFSGTDSLFVQVVGYVNADVAMSMILSAYVVRAVGRVVLRKSP